MKRFNRINSEYEQLITEAFRHSTTLDELKIRLAVANILYSSSDYSFLKWVWGISPTLSYTGLRNIWRAKVAAYALQHIDGLLTYEKYCGLLRAHLSIEYQKHLRGMNDLLRLNRKTYSDLKCKATAPLNMSSYHQMLMSTYYFVHGLQLSKK